MRKQVMSQSDSVGRPNHYLRENIMRKFNSIITSAILLLFVLHIVWGVLVLCGIAEGGNPVLSHLGYVLLFLVCIHMLIGCKLTADSIKACKRSGVSYFRENRLFWIRRISGFGLLLFLILHVWLFLPIRSPEGAYRLRFFGPAEYAFQILFVLTLLLHVLTNIKPLMLSLGVKSFAAVLTDILFILSVILLIAGVAFTVYFIRWQVI